MNDGLALKALACVSLAASGGFLFLGSKWTRAAALPVGCPIFMMPLREAAVNWFERASALACAEAAAVYSNMARATLERHGTVFDSPRVMLAITKGCSGIRSSSVLCITSLVTMS